MNRQRWYQWHNLAGLPLAVLLCFIMLTGTLAVMSHELDWLSNPAMRTDSADAPMNWPRFYRQVLSASDGDRIYQLSVPEHSGFAAQAILYNSENMRYRLFFDPVTYELTGDGSWYNWQTTLRQIHRHLMMPLNIGLPIVTLTAFPLVLSLVSGLILHPAWWKGLWRLPRNNNRRVFWGDLHRITGLWSSWLLLIIAFTGVWYFAEKYGLDATYPVDGNVESEQAIIEAVRVQPEHFDQLIRKAMLERPALHIKTVFFPVEAGQPVRIEGQAGNILVRDRANNMIFDPVSGALLSQRSADDLSAHVRISEAADPLHFGIWGGYWSKGLYFVFGLLLTSLAVTGTIIYAHRIFKWRRHAMPGIKSVLKAGFGEMKITGMLCLILIITCGLCTVFTLTN